MTAAPFITSDSGRLLAPSRPVPLALAGFPARDEATGRPYHYLRKEAVRAGAWHHRSDGKAFEITRGRIDAWVSAFQRRLAAGIRPFVPGRHTEAPRAEDNHGYVVGLSRDGDSLYADVQLVGDDSLALAAKNDVSIYVVPEGWDAAGNAYGEHLHHLALTPNPNQPHLGPFVRIAASAGGGGGSPEGVDVPVVEFGPPPVEIEPPPRPPRGERAERVEPSRAAMALAAALLGVPAVRSAAAVRLALAAGGANCGDGAGGFATGNTCAAGGSGKLVPPPGAYESISHFAAGEPLTDIGRAAMEYAGVSHGYDATHHQNVHDMLAAVTEDARHSARLNPAKNHLAKAYVDLRLAKDIIAAEIHKNPAIAKDIGNIRGPWAGMFIGEMAPGGELAQFPHMIEQRVKRYAEDSKPYKVRPVKKATAALSAAGRLLLSLAAGGGNCGTGTGGFAANNTCAKGGGSGGYGIAPGDHVILPGAAVPLRVTKVDRKGMVYATHAGAPVGDAGTYMGQHASQARKVDAGGGTVPAAPAAPAAVARGHEPLPQFAAAVQKAVDATDAGGFGANKVFVGHAYRGYVAGGGEPMGLPTFKARLIEARQAGLLSLSRADVPGAMDPADVAESATSYLNSESHFVTAAPKSRHPGEKDPVERLAVAPTRQQVRDDLIRKGHIIGRPDERKRLGLSAEPPRSAAGRRLLELCGDVPCAACKAEECDDGTGDGADDDYEPDPAFLPPEFLPDGLALSLAADAGTPCRSAAVARAVLSLAGSHGGDCDWKTIDGAHVCIGGDGKVSQGPAALTGKSLAAGSGTADGWYEKSEVPPGWFVHGRARQQTLKTGFAIQGTQDVDVADQYAGKKGSVWYVRPKPGAKTMDFADPEVRAKVVDRLASDHEDGSAPEMYDRAVAEHGEDGAKGVIEKELNVPDIVDTAGPFDDAGFVSWLWERFEPDAAMVGHKRGEGVVVLNNDPSVIETVKVGGKVGGDAGRRRRIAATRG